MSYAEAWTDGVRVENDKGIYTRYYPPCYRCGAEVFSYNYIRGFKYVCFGCKARDQIARENRKGMARMRKI